MILNEKFKLVPKDLGLRLGLFGAESGLQNSAFRKTIEEKWGIKAMDANYGMADVLSIFGAECYEQNGLHFMGDGVLLPELINSETLESLPIQENQIGELVLTNLDRETQPLIRYRTSDVIKVLSTKKCTCGNSGFKFEIIGRSDDMFVVKGVNVFVNALSNIINSYLNELSGDFQIHINNRPPIDKVLLILERKNKFISEIEAINLYENILYKCKINLNISPEIKFLDFGILPKTEGKSKRIFKTL
jgi:phenylacetate-CoA ligase